MGDLIDVDNRRGIFGYIMLECGCRQWWFSDSVSLTSFLNSRHSHLRGATFVYVNVRR
jgi:hypothetical protein